MCNVVNHKGIYDQSVGNSTSNTMSLVNINNISVLNNQSKFTDPMAFQITFECLEKLEDDLEWKILYVSPDCHSELILEEILVGPVPIGVNKFTVEADPPTFLTDKEVLGVTAVFITCSYREREFVRVGYYVHNLLEGYDDEEERHQRKKRRRSTSNRKIDISQVTRHIMADKPRMTKFVIPWDSKNPKNSVITDNFGSIITVDKQQQLVEATRATTPQTIPDLEDEQIEEELCDDEETEDYFAIDQREKHRSVKASVITKKEMVRMVTV